MSEQHYLNITQKLDADHPQRFKIDILFSLFPFYFSSPATSLIKRLNLVNAINLFKFYKSKEMVLVETMMLSCGVRVR